MKHQEEEQPTATTCDDPDTITVVHANGTVEVKPAPEKQWTYVEQVIAARKKRHRWLGSNGWGGG